MVAKNTSIALGEHFTRFASEQVASGRYGSVSEVIRAGLRLLEDEHQRMDALREAIREGDESGDPVPFDFDAWLEERQRTHAD
jgi:antitoxin ParD1/3/4